MLFKMVCLKDASLAMRNDVIRNNLLITKLQFLYYSVCIIIAKQILEVYQL